MQKIPDIITTESKGFVQGTYDDNTKYNVNIHIQTQNPWFPEPMVETIPGNLVGATPGPMVAVGGKG